MRLGPTTADAHNRSRLIGVHSSFDWIPIVGEMVRSRAIEEYRRSSRGPRPKSNTKSPGASNSRSTTAPTKQSTRWNSKFATV